MAEIITWVAIGALILAENEGQRPAFIYMAFLKQSTRQN